MSIQSVHRYSDAAFVAPEPIQAQPYEYVVPVFDIDFTYTGVATLVATADMTNTTQNIALRRPMDPPEDEPDYVFAVRWTLNGTNYRAKLWDDGGTLQWPVYNGETIGTDAVFEVWAVANVANVTLAEDYSFYSSQMKERADPMDLTPATQPSEIITLDLIEV